MTDNQKIIVHGTRRYHGNSQQEEFVLDSLEYKRDGYYVELGAFHSRNESNTFILERDFNWHGVSFELRDDRRDEFNANRRNPCYGDALQFDYLTHFKSNNFPTQIDFLQIDIDLEYNELGRPRGNPMNCLHGLITLPLTQYRFSVICFEHDMCMYYKNQTMRDVQREILDSLGYLLLVRDVGEDWWVDPLVIDPHKCRQYFNRTFLRQFYEPKQTW